LSTPIAWLDEPLDRGRTDERLWSGAISTSETNRLKHRSLDEYLASASDYYYKVTPHAHVRCIDGRRSKHVAEVKSREGLLDEELGPQAPGGSPVVALSHRIAEWESLEPANILDDISRTIKLYGELGLNSPVGGHDDDHAEFPNTGCGAIDKMPRIIGRIADPMAKAIIRHYTEAIAGDIFSEKCFEPMLEKYRVLDSPEYRKSYLMQTTDDEYGYRSGVLEALKVHHGKSVQTMVGHHNEIAVVINMVTGTTFHRDLFSWDSQNEAQIFNYDYWHSIERAKAVYAKDPEKRVRFLISRVMYAVGTCMILTDGSLRVGVRS
jgi:hypothetical protein